MRISEARREEIADLLNAPTGFAIKEHIRFQETNIRR